VRKRKCQDGVSRRNNNKKEGGKINNEKAEGIVPDEDRRRWGGGRIYTKTKFFNQGKGSKLLSPAPGPKKNLQQTEIKPGKGENNTRN